MFYTSSGYEASYFGTMLVLGNVSWISIAELVTVRKSEIYSIIIVVALLLMQCGHNVCIFLVDPQAGHLLRLLTSFSAFPANSLCLFFMCDVLLFGTAFKMPSQISPKMPGIVCRAAGIAIANLGRERSGA
jgi:hypothetical protein